MKTGIGGATSIGNGPNTFLQDVDFSDPHATAQAWVVVLTAMLMDHRYLYLN